jgi:zeaxanthin epoxidase
MQPNLGQGGCMAIEDAYQLVLDLCQEADRVEGEAAQGRPAAMDVERVLTGYTLQRVVRAASIHGMAGMAAYMASTYKAYLGEGLGPLEWLTQFKIPHPGRVVGQIIMKATMPGTMSRILGGYRASLARSERVSVCHLADQPRGFPEHLFPLYMEDDDALLRASHAHWVLTPITEGIDEQALHLEFEAAKRQSPVITRQGVTVGRAADCDMVVDAPSSQRHARLHQCEAGDYHVTDLDTQNGTWVNGRRLNPGMPFRLHPGDIVRFGSAEQGAKDFKVRMVHKSLLEDGGRHGSYDRRAPAGGRQMALSSK